MNIKFMEYALELARGIKSDIPVASVIVKENKIIAFGVNEKEKKQNAIYHAEILAIKMANKILNNWRLEECEMYVTLEPCPMCASAIIQARINKVYFGAYDMLNGAFGSKIDMRNIMNYNVEIKGGIMEEECSQILKDYFIKLRHKI